MADTYNDCIRKVTLDGVVTTLAGKPCAHIDDFADGVGAQARFNKPRGIAVDKQGNVIIGDSSNCVVRKCTPDGVVSTIAGLADQDAFADGYGGEARFKGMGGVVVDDENNILISDMHNQRIRMIVSGTRHVITIAGTGEPGKVDGKGLEAQVRYPNGIALGVHGEIIVNDGNKRCLRVIRRHLPWEFARVLYLGVLKGQRAAGGGDGGGDGGGSGGGGEQLGGKRCLFAMLPVEGTSGLVCPILARIIQLTQMPSWGPPEVRPPPPPKVPTVRVETKFGGFVEVPAPTGGPAAAGAPQGGTEAGASAVADNAATAEDDARAEEESRVLRQQILDLEKQLQEMRAQEIRFAEGLGGGALTQLYDFSSDPPTPMPGVQLLAPLGQQLPDAGAPREGTEI